MYPELIAGGFIIGDYIYHRWIEDKPKPKPASEISIPRVEEGASVPMIYGRCRVRQPYLAFAGTPSAQDTADQFSDALALVYPLTYTITLFYVLGMPFKGGTNRIRRMWAGELELAHQSDLDFAGGLATLDAMDGNNGPQDVFDRGQYSCSVRAPDLRDVGVLQGFVEFFNGKDDQVVVGGFPDTTQAGIQMATDTGDGNLVPDFVGYMCCFLWGNFGFEGWLMGGGSTLQAYSFEVSSYPAEDASLLESGLIGIEANPADVIRDLMSNDFGKLGIPLAQIDTTTFAYAAQLLADEGNGYSRSIETQNDAGEIIGEILRQIDGVIYEDNVDGKYKLKLIRGDYDPSAVPLITPDNCEPLTNSLLVGWTNIVNKVRVVFNDRQGRYEDNSANAQNQANAAGQDGVVREVVLQYPGVCTTENAEAICARELAARSRPLAKCSALVDREFYRVNQGDPVAVTWPEYQWNGVLFRVANVDRGDLDSGKIRLDLIQDFFYQHRGSIIPLPIAPFPTDETGGFA